MSMRELGLDPQRTPYFLRGPLGQAYLYTLSAMHDELLGALKQALYSGYPSFAEPDSMGEIARDRRILLFPGETQASKIARLQGWLSAHRHAGLPSGILAQSAAYWLPELPTMRIVAGNSIHAMWATRYGNDATATLEGATAEELDDKRVDPVHGRPAGRKLRFHYASPSNWDWDSAYPFAAEPPTIHRWWVILYAPPTITPHGVVEPPQPGISLGSSLPVQDGQNVFDLANYWRSIGTTLWGWILAFDPASFVPTLTNLDVPGGYPDGTWYQSYIPGVGFNRLQTARYYVQHNCIGAS